VIPLPEQNHSIYTQFRAYTRLSESAYCKNLELVKQFSDIQGCVVECGVWRGGMIAGIARVLGPRKYYLFDSFEGLPEPTEINGAKALEWHRTNVLDGCKTDKSYAHEAMKGTDYEVVKGWFKDTLPQFKEKIAILSLDCDWYSSITECLNYLYEHVVLGGLIILDDYPVWLGCRRAVRDFLSANRLTDKIMQFEGVYYFVKREGRPVVKIAPKEVANNEIYR